ncbi:hypothetical protein LEP1GSC083_2506 [Leptospira interrogans serovar Pyrogenes str. L0374]|uniref:ABC transporter domain-containing protein n=1 Tax=Leptospira interrogans serovar Pyrogenes str. L0374 TaxID=1049928 RepID=M6K636_LEPIR|nr:hypothetical protein LEP1GSC083_2506 [Leptospira interrogans serovar Pyrogenes str. L0374]
MPSSDKAIEIQKLNLRLGQRIILDSISFEVNSGTILGILGRSGSGKTSLFRAILGVPTTTNLEQSGSIYFSERPEKNSDPSFTTSLSRSCRKFQPCLVFGKSFERTTPNFRGRNCK